MQLRRVAADLRGNTGGGADGPDRRVPACPADRPRPGRRRTPDNRPPSAYGSDSTRRRPRLGAEAGPSATPDVPVALRARRGAGGRPDRRRPHEGPPARPSHVAGPGVLRRVALHRGRRRQRPRRHYRAIVLHGGQPHSRAHAVTSRRAIGSTRSLEAPSRPAAVSRHGPRSTASTVLIDPMQDVRSFALGIFVRGGLRARRPPSRQGISHFLEHVLFKRTRRRSQRRDRPRDRPARAATSTRSRPRSTPASTRTRSTRASPRRSTCCATSCCRPPSSRPTSRSSAA